MRPFDLPFRQSRDSATRKRLPYELVSIDIRTLNGKKQIARLNFARIEGKAGDSFAIRLTRWDSSKNGCQLDMTQATYKSYCRTSSAFNASFTSFRSSIGCFVLPMI